jgi:hypothetical protein
MQLPIQDVPRTYLPACNVTESCSWDRVILSLQQSVILTGYTFQTIHSTKRDIPRNYISKRKYLKCNDTMKVCSQFAIICMCNKIWSYIYITCVCVCVYVCMYVCVCVCMCLCMYLYMYVFMYVCIYVCMYVCMYVYMYVCVYACVYVRVWMPAYSVWTAQYVLLMSPICHRLVSCAWGVGKHAPWLNVTAYVTSQQSKWSVRPPQEMYAYASSKKRVSTVRERPSLKVGQFQSSQNAPVVQDTRWWS